MDCIVLAGGRAEHLWPLTKNCPKVLLKISGKPILSYILEKLVASAFIDRIFISIDNDKFNIFEKSFKEFNVTHSGKKIQLVNHNLFRGRPIGPYKKILEVIDRYKINNENLFVIAGDNILNFDLNDFYEFYKSHKKSCNAIYKNEKVFDPSKFGMATIDTDKNIINFEEKPKSKNFKKITNAFISTGCYIFINDDIILLNKYIKESNPDVLGQFLKFLHHKKRLKGYKFTDIWFDIGTRKNLLLANANAIKELNINKYPDIFIDEESHICHGNLISAGTELSKTIIDENVYIGNNCSIENSIINNSIIYDNCKIKNSKISNCVVGADSIIEANLDKLVIGIASSVLEGDDY
ncbi:NDP-sugar synthase [bacterium]|nr:MAG: NDP-sugar synthase [bacterium]